MAFAGLTIVISGKFNKSQAEVKKLVTKNSGRVTSAVTDKTDFVISDAIGSTKTTTAVKKGIPVVTEDWIDKCIETGDVSAVTGDEYFVSKGKGGGGSKKAKGGSKKAKAADDDEEEEEEEEKKPKRKRKAKKKDDDEEEAPKKKKPASKKAGTKRKKAGGGVFDGLTFCITGAAKRSQADLKSFLEENGASTAGTVTAKVTHVVAAALGTSKSSKAVDKGLPVVTEAWVDKSVEDGALSTDSSLFLSQPDGADDDDNKPAKKAKTSRKPAKKKKKDEEEEEEEEEEEKPKKKASKEKKKASKEKKKASKKDDDDEEDDTDKKKSKPPTSGDSLKKVVVKGKAPVDDACPRADETHVFDDSEGVWDAMLNQTNIDHNNNKYYIIQLLEKDGGGMYYCWNRWGRVGKTAGSAMLYSGNDLSKGKKAFEKKFKDKTKNNWADRASFRAVSGKYTLLERDYTPDDLPTSADGGKAEIPDSKLDGRVQDLVKLICDLKMMSKQMMEIGYDAKKLPLGKLSKMHIKKGYDILKSISEQLEGKRQNLTELSSEFYTLIPHDFGMQRPPIIKTQEMLKEKLTMVEALADIVVATKLLRDGGGGGNPIDTQYSALNCAMEPVEKNSEEWKLIQTYVTNTHASTHKNYSLHIMEVFKLVRGNEDEKYSKWSKTENRRLLWHGSRLTNFVGILSQGLRIAPPEAPVTGYMFGKGVYFADMVSKSANYCATNKQNNIGIALLCDVALGKMSLKTAADYFASTLPADHLSTKGVGKTYPDPTEDTPHPDDPNLIIPLGKAVNQTMPTTLLYNEFIVYDTSQIKMKYLLKLRFDYK